MWSHDEFTDTLSLGLVGAACVLSASTWAVTLQTVTVSVLNKGLNHSTDVVKVLLKETCRYFTSTAASVVTLTVNLSYHVAAWRTGAETEPPPGSVSANQINCSSTCWTHRDTSLINNKEQKELFVLFGGFLQRGSSYKLWLWCCDVVRTGSMWSLVKVQCWLSG